jgi:hypothetical protein
MTGVDTPNVATFSQITDPNFRARSLSIAKKRKSSEEADLMSDVVGEAYNNSVCLTQVMGAINKIMETQAEPSPLPKCFKELEKVLTRIVDFNMNLAARYASLMVSTDKSKETIERNVVSGNLATSVENSAAYKKSCDDLVQTALQCKVFNIDFGSELNSHSDIVTKSKEILNTHESLKDILPKVNIAPLGKSTKLNQDGNQSVPLLLKVKTVEDKIKLQEGIRQANLKTGFHWPKNLIDNISKMRSQLSEYENEELNLKNKHILIRPNFETGKSLNILYREAGSTVKWTHLETVKVPVEAKLLAKFKCQQICKSKYFNV